MKPEHERWAEALLVERHHGEQAPLIIAERVRALALKGDEEGVARWMTIATRYDQLRDSGTERH
jgi:hypothetical protein